MPVSSQVIAEVSRDARRRDMRDMIVWPVAAALIVIAPLVGPGKPPGATWHGVDAQSAEPQLGPSGTPTLRVGAGGNGRFQFAPGFPDDGQTRRKPNPARITTGAISRQRNQDDTTTRKEPTPSATQPLPSVLDPAQRDVARPKPDQSRGNDRRARTHPRSARAMPDEHDRRKPLAPVVSKDDMPPPKGDARSAPRTSALPTPDLVRHPTAIDGSDYDDMRIARIPGVRDPEPSTPTDAAQFSPERPVTPQPETSPVRSETTMPAEVPEATGTPEASETPETSNTPETPRTAKPAASSQTALSPARDAEQSEPEQAVSVLRTDAVPLPPRPQLAKPQSVRPRSSEPQSASPAEPADRAARRPSREPAPARPTPEQQIHRSAPDHSAQRADTRSSRRAARRRVERLQNRQRTTQTRRQTQQSQGGWVGPVPSWARRAFDR